MQPLSGPSALTAARSDSFSYMRDQQRTQSGLCFLQPRVLCIVPGGNMKRQSALFLGTDCEK